MTNVPTFQRSTFNVSGHPLPAPIRKLLLVGVGLIGGSVGLAAKRNGFRGRIVGLGRRPLEDALARGAIDTYTQDPVAAADADLVVICTPVDLIADKVRELVPFLKAGCVITDVGSVKQPVVAEVEDLLPASCHFVGSHPMAGSEQAGVGAASAMLFRGADCLITPTERTDAEALARVERFWQCLGTRTVRMSPVEHDFLIGAASHLPHLVACALTQTVAKTENEAGKAIDFAATGFRDTTRIAASSPSLWTQILLQNREALLHTMEEMLNCLQRYHHALSHADAEELAMLLENARFWRESWGRREPR